MKRSVSIIIPALNEEKHIAATIAVARSVASRLFEAFEIIVVNDGSTDRTGPVADAQAGSDVRVVHNPRPRNLGGAYKQALGMAKMEYVTWIAGKNGIAQEDLHTLWQTIGRADLIVPFACNTDERPLFRRIVSGAFTLLLDSLCRMKVKYYNHFVVCRRELLQGLEIRTDSYAFQAEILIKLIAQGVSYVEVPIRDYFGNDTNTKAFSLRNVKGVASFLWKIRRDIAASRKQLRRQPLAPAQ